MSFSARSGENCLSTADAATSNARIQPPSEIKCAKSASRNLNNSCSTSSCVAANSAFNSSILFFLAVSNIAAACRFTRSPMPSDLP